MSEANRVADIQRWLTDEDAEQISQVLHQRGDAAARRLEARLIARRKREARPNGAIEQGEQLDLIGRRP